jgi:hypothetical protein
VPTRRRIDVAASFLDDFYGESEDVQLAVLSEIHYVATNPSSHGQIYQASWNDPTRFVDVGYERALFWLDSEPILLLGIGAIPWRLPSSP